MVVKTGLTCWVERAWEIEVQGIERVVVGKR